MELNDFIKEFDSTFSKTIGEYYYRTRVVNPELLRDVLLYVELYDPEAPKWRVRHLFNPKDITKPLEIEVPEEEKEEFNKANAEEKKGMLERGLEVHDELLNNKNLMLALDVLTEKFDREDAFDILTMDTEETNYKIFHEDEFKNKWGFDQNILPLKNGYFIEFAFERYDDEKQAEFDRHFRELEEEY